MSQKTIAFLGAGSMGGAIVRGLAAAGGAHTLIATNRSRAKADELAATQGVQSVALEVEPDANLRVASAADVLLIGVKPAMVPDLLREIAAQVRPGTVVVSLAAGVTIATFEGLLPDGIPVLRSMPNTPSLVGKGVTGLAPGTHATAEHMTLVRELFEAVGVVIEVPESQIDPLSTVSGSGPAYVFFLIEQLTRAAVHQGFSEEQARVMAEQTFIGATALLDASGDDPAELRRRVTSPKGTTERAVQVLADAGLDVTFEAATDAALARAKEMAAGG